MARGGCSIANRNGDAWGFIVGAVGLILVGSLLGLAPPPTGMPTAGSTYSREPDGLHAIYDVLQAEGHVLRWQRSTGRLPSTVALLILWQPDPISEKEWQALLNWVEQGHILVISSHQRSPARLEETAGSVAFSAMVHPATLGVKKLSVGPIGFADSAPQTTTMIIGPDAGPVLVSWEHGQGRIYWSADPEWLSNARIANDDNFVLAMRLLRPAPGKQVAFNEFHHGVQAAESWIQLLRAPLKLFLLYLTLALALCFWSAGTRFGSPRPIVALPPRAAMEYVYSMAQLYRRASARTAVLHALHHSLLRDLSGLTGGTAQLSHQEIALGAAARAEMSPQALETLLKQTHPDQEKLPSDRELLTLARTVTETQRRVRRAGYRDSKRA